MSRMRGAGLSRRQLIARVLPLVHSSPYRLQWNSSPRMAPSSNDVGDRHLGRCQPVRDPIHKGNIPGKFDRLGTASRLG